jgi:hypothetical protein
VFAVEGAVTDTPRGLLRMRSIGDWAVLVASFLVAVLLILQLLSLFSTS